MGPSSSSPSSSTATGPAHASCRARPPPMGRMRPPARRLWPPTLGLFCAVCGGGDLSVFSLGLRCLVPVFLLRRQGGDFAVWAPSSSSSAASGAPPLSVCRPRVALLSAAHPRGPVSWPTNVPRASRDSTPRSRRRTWVTLLLCPPWCPTWRPYHRVASARPCAPQHRAPALRRWTRFGVSGCVVAVAAEMSFRPRRRLRPRQPMNRHEIRRARPRVNGLLLEPRPPCRVAVMAMTTPLRTLKVRLLLHHAGRHLVGRADLLSTRG